MGNVTSINGITKDTPLIRTIGGNRTVHAIGCPTIRDWDMAGCEPLYVAKPGKMRFCPECDRMIWTSIGAKDYMKHRKEYNELYRITGMNPYKVRLLYQKARAKTELRNGILYIHAKEQFWKIDLTDPENLVLWHGNYSDRGNDVVSNQGYHEHELRGTGARGRMSDALNQISDYDHEKAKETHKKNKVRVTFSELDPEYYGFEM